MSGERTTSGAGADSMQVYRRLVGYVRPHTGRLVAGFVFGLVYALSNGAFVWVLKGGIREVFAEATAANVLVIALLFPVTALVRGVADYLATYYIKWVGHRVVMDLRNAMFAHLQTLSVGYFSQSRTGELISRTTNDTMMVENAVSSVITDLAKQPVTLVCMVGWVFYVDAQLAALSMVVFPLCVLPIAAFGRKVRRYSRQAQERIADVVAILQESLSGVRIVKAFGREGHEVGRFSAQTAAFFSRILRVTRASAIVEPIIVLIAASGIAAVLAYVKTVNMSVDDFFAFAAALFMMYEPVKKLSKVYVSIQQSSSAAERVFQVLDTPNSVADRPGAVDFSGSLAEISFENVSFVYENAPVLRDVSFRVAAGQRVAFVGSSGAGKTTLVSLLPRFYDVTGGRVLLNGRDLRDLTMASIRRLIGLVTQDTFLFNDTIAANIAYGMPDASRAQTEQSARLAHAHDFIMAQPRGYDTVVGERGARLSGGERQRISIARAIIRNPPILILDEATSALDTESERLVQAAINEVMKGRTVFAIAHRLSTIVSCDRILVLSGGLVVEEGTHAELLARGGAYKRLYDMQFETVPGA